MKGGGEGARRGVKRVGKGARGSSTSVENTEHSHKKHAYNFGSDTILLDSSTVIIHRGY